MNGDLRARNEARCRRIVDTAAPLELDDLEWAAVPHTPVARDVIDALVYMRDVEGFTDRDLVGFVAHRTTLRDPLLREFLELWRAEEAGHTRALTQFLDAYAGRGDIEIPSRQAPPPAQIPLIERALSRVGGPVGEVVCAAHMSWGALNELLTLNGYRLLGARCGHPVLAELLRRIAAQEARHYSFYLLQAEWRLAGSRIARALLPRVLRKSWTPVGVGDGYKPADEFARVARYLASGDDGRRSIERMDARIARLPGFDDLRVYSNMTVAA